MNVSRELYLGSLLLVAFRDSSPCAAVSLAGVLDYFTIPLYKVDFFSSQPHYKPSNTIQVWLYGG